jgi:hypothetical protein
MVFPRVFSVSILAASFCGSPASAVEPALDAALEATASGTASIAACGFQPNAAKTAWTRTCGAPQAEPWPWPDGPDHPVATLTSPVTTYQAFTAGVYRLALSGPGALWFTVGTQAAQRCAPSGTQTTCDLTLTTAATIGLEVRKPTGSATISVTRCPTDGTYCL